MPFKTPEERKNYRINHREREKAHNKKWEENHPERAKQSMNERVRRWRLKHPEDRKRTRRRNKAKRRKLGFVPLNEPFAGSDAHHIDKIHIIYVPKSLHDSIRHNIWTGKGMTEINSEVYKWLGFIPL